MIGPWFDPGAQVGSQKHHKLLALSYTNLVLAGERGLGQLVRAVVGRSHLGPGQADQSCNNIRIIVESYLRNRIMLGS